MCVVSAVSDPYRKQDMWPNWPNIIPFPEPNIQPMPAKDFYKAVTREEFEALKRDVEELRILLVNARQYDIANGEPDCEMEDKVAIIKAIAKMVGVDLGDVFPNDKST